MWKQFISGYLNYTKKERIGILALLSIIVFFALLPYSFPYLLPREQYDHSDFEKAIASLRLKQVDSIKEFRKANYNSHYQYAGADRSNDGRSFKGELFYFDPNTATTAEWQRLGLHDKTIATIQKYLSKGGKFYKKEDIGKIWGLHKNEVDRLMPYVQVKSVYAAPYAHPEFEKKAAFKKELPIIIDINTADTTAFIALPGIGSKLAQRIINFRDKLGGFYQIAQVGETFGLADSTFQKIRSLLNVNDKGIKRININTASVDDMKLHPYIRYNLANSIVQYRNQHGRFNAITDLKKIMTVTDEILNKLSPYLTIE